MLVLSWEHYQSLSQEKGIFERQVDPCDPEDQIIAYLPDLATGYKRDIILRNGIQLTLHDYVFQQDHLLLSLPPCLDYLEIVFNLSSTYWLGNDIEITAGRHYWADPSTHEIREKAGEHKVAVDLHLPLDSLPDLFGDQKDIFLESRGTTSGNLSTKGTPQPIQKITRAMLAALRQILNCPYQGVVKKLYLESKSLELLALLLEEKAQKNLDSQPRVYLSPGDVERIHHASSILQKQIPDPPSLLELSRQVGLNDCTLKRGFQMVFGTTVFGYLHQLRMDQAAQLLKQQELTISRVAASVGYASPTSFSMAFRKHCGLSPKQYQLQYR